VSSCTAKNHSKKSKVKKERIIQRVFASAISVFFVKQACKKVSKVDSTLQVATL
jgi:hypothetical protein